MGLDKGVLALHRVSEHSDDREIGRTHASLKAVVLQNRSRMVSEREKNVVIELLEAAGPVRANHDSLEPVVHVNRDGHKRRDLVVGGGQPVTGSVLAHYFVSFEDPLGEPLGHRALAGVVLEPPVTDQVEPPVAVAVTFGEEEPALCLRQTHGHFKNQLLEVRTCSVAPVQVHDLAAKLPRPGALGLAGSVHSQPKLSLVTQ